VITVRGRASLKKDIKIFKKIRKTGLIETVEIVANRINYPKRGFPRYGVNRFMKRVVSKISDNALVLDAGAGSKPYAHFFANMRYHSCDHPGASEEIYGDKNNSAHEYFCDLLNIPVKNNQYDAVVCTQVLEHVPDPGRVLKELSRIIKPGGKVFLTVPQCFGVHMAPYNYFNFLEHGLRLLAGRADLRVESLETIGGIFWLLGKVSNNTSIIIWNKFGRLKLIFSPFYFAFRAFFTVFLFMLFHLDRIDRGKKWTIGYTCTCVKPHKGRPYAAKS